MSVCKLPGCVCPLNLLSSRSRLFWPKPVQTLRRHTSTIASATASATLTLDADKDTSILFSSGAFVLDGWLRSGEPSGQGSPSSSANAANANVKLLRNTYDSDAAEVQRVLDEMSWLMEELDPELNKLRAFTSCLEPPQPQEQSQQHPGHHHPHHHPQPQLLLPPQVPPVARLPPNPSGQLPTSFPKPLATQDTPQRAALSSSHSGGSSSSNGANSSSGSSSSSGALESVFDPLACAAPATSGAIGPVGLSLPSLSLPATAAGARGGGTVEAAGAGAAGAGSRGERRRQNWRRGAAAAASTGPTHEAKYKAQGTGSMTILMGSFSKDHILSSSEEQLLAAAAQDFMRLNDLTRLLAAVLKRPPSLAETARSLQCEEGALRVRLDAGNRARTLLAQKNYRLVVNIAKRMMRGAATGGGGGGAGGPGGGSGSPSSGGGGAAQGGGGASLDDAITVGMEALMYAIRKFKPEAGYRLSTYATWWIRMHVGKLVQAQAGVVTLTSYQRSNLERMRAARARLRSQLPSGAHPTAEQIAEAAGLSTGQVAQAAAMERSVVAGARSFEARLADDGASVEELVAIDDDSELADGGGSSLFQDAEDFAANATLASTVEGLLASLDRGEADALRAEYDLWPVEEEGGGEEGEERQLEAAAAGARPAVKGGAQRLKLGRKSRVSAGRALEKLRVSTAKDARLAEWVGLRSSKTNLPGRTAAYGKRSRG